MIARLDRLLPLLPTKPRDGPAAKHKGAYHESTQNNRRPTHRLYTVTGEGDKANWQEIGAAWPNRDGEGFSITFTAIPLTGHIVMRTAKERPATD